MDITPMKHPKPLSKGAGQQQIDTTEHDVQIATPSSQLMMDTPLVHPADDKKEDDILEPSFEIYGSIDSEQPSSSLFDDLIIAEQSRSTLDLRQGGSVVLNKTPCHQNHHDQLPASTSAACTAMATPAGQNHESSSTPVTPDTATSTRTRLDHQLPSPATTTNTYNASLYSTEPIPSAEAQSVTSSITDSNLLTDMSTVQQRAYKLYKKRAKKQQQQDGTNTLTGACLPTMMNESGPLQDIIEGVQLCTMICMAELFDEEEDNEELTLNEDEKRHGVKSKVDRMKETNNSFLGKMIQCGGMVEGSCVDGEEECSVLGDDFLEMDELVLLDNDDENSI